jgi:hypothetical protein
MNVAGIYSKYFDIEGYNNLIYNTGGPCLALTWGGRYNFRNSTFASFWDYPARKEPAVILNNFSDLPQYFPLEKAYFGNCIIMGNQKSEVAINKCSSCTESFNYEFNHCLIKADNSIDFTLPNFNTSVKYDKDASIEVNYVFKDYVKKDYHLIANSAAIGIGSDLNILEIPNEKNDLDGVLRKSPPSAGCYEY